MKPFMSCHSEFSPAHNQDIIGLPMHVAPQCDYACRALCSVALGSETWQHLGGERLDLIKLA